MLEIRDIAKNINKKSDYKKKTGKRMQNIIYKSLQEGVFPKICKETMVMLVEKINNKNKCAYRPINNLKISEKILEKIIKNQLEDFMEKYKLLSKYQSAFRKWHSCEIAVIYNYNIKVKELKLLQTYLADRKRLLGFLSRTSSSEESLCLFGFRRGTLCP